MTSKIEISVIVCTYNRAKLLCNCLQSLADQTFNKSLYEVIVVNNNSAKTTNGLVEEFTINQPNFKVVVERKQVLSPARNRGYKEAKGEYVAYIDDDAKATHNWIEEIHSFICRHPEIQVFGGPYCGFSLVDMPEWFPPDYGTMSHGEIERPLSETEWISGTNMVYKRSLLNELGGFNVNIGMRGKQISYGEETNLLIRIRERKLPIYYCPKIVVNHVIMPYKLSLAWLIWSNYTNGYSGAQTFGCPYNLIRYFAILAYIFLKSVATFCTSDEKYTKRRLYYSFRSFFWQVGFTKSVIELKSRRSAFLVNILFYLTSGMVQSLKMTL